jgi:glucoamylase
MPRDIPVGNGRLLVCFDKEYRIRDIYFPHVGQENHVSGNPFRFGVWAEGRFSWVGHEWKRSLLYMEDTLVTEVSLQHPGLGLLIVCHDAVDFHENVYVREIGVENLQPRERELRLFFSQNFDISGHSVGDTAAYDPPTGGLVHYKGARYFLVNGMDGEGRGLSQFAVGQKNTSGQEGTFRDAEDGRLSGNPIAQGSVDSAVALHLSLPPLGKGIVFYWLGAGETWKDVRRLDRRVKEKGPQTLLRRTGDYWRLWARKATPPLEFLPQAVQYLYRRSLLVLRTQIDWRGGILAGNDSDVILFNRDTYSYVWPRDGALVANALDLAGYPMAAQHFYQFAGDVIGRSGYFLHKYNPDGTLASSWHPWFSDGREQLPIQEDETALVLWALWKHFSIFRDIDFIKPLYVPLVKATADFLCRYRDPATGLPLPSYDLWEERRGILSFTVGAVFGGLTAASLFCKVFGEEDKEDEYRRAAAEIRDAATAHLWRPDLNRFCRMLGSGDGEALTVDETCDASLWGLFAFGMYDADDPRIVATMEAVRDRLWLSTEVGGMARYEDDPYHQVSSRYPGNPWFVCSLWFADFLIARAQNEGALAEPVEILQWVADHALPSGVLAEQVHPETGVPLSVSPLTWSHATFVAATQHVLRRLAGMKVCPTCGLSTVDRSSTEDWLDRLFADSCNAIHGSCRLD